MLVLLIVMRMTRGIFRMIQVVLFYIMMPHRKLFSLNILMICSTCYYELYHHSHLPTLVLHSYIYIYLYLNHRLVHKNLYHFISARFNFLCSFHMVKKKGVRVFVSKLWFRNSCIYIDIFLGVYMHGLTYHKPIHSQNPHLTTQHP